MMWCVYDLVLDGETVYVGLTRDPEERHKQHKCNRAAAAETRMVVVREYRRKRDAVTAERRRIVAVRPPWNRQHLKKEPEEIMPALQASKIWFGRACNRDKIRHMKGWTIDMAYQHLGTKDRPKV